MIKLLTIVPRLPSSIDGVGDYALHLARSLREQWKIETEFIVCDPNWSVQSEVQGFRVSHLKERSTSDLLQLIQTHHAQTTQLFLHYVGYGYARWGAPRWLINGLEIWRSNSSDRQLVTMFHEIYAVPGHKPWRHPFWNSHLQRSLSTKLAQVSDHVLTSSENYAALLDTFRSKHHAPTPYLPVFSTVGEPIEILDWKDREPILVIFGNTSVKHRIYRENQAQLPAICEEFQIQEIVDIGPSTGLNISKIGSTPLWEAGKLEIEPIAKLLSRSKIGFLNYDPNHLAKSTIFAAYCAYGLLPINPTHSVSTCDGVIPGYHYWTLEDVENYPQDVAHNAYHWYQSHSLRSQADHFAKLLLNDTPHLP
jgi:hypothetical protein